MFSFEKEAIKLSKLGKSWEQSVVVAKSIGTLLAVYCVSKNIIKPSKAIFLGFPSKMNGEKDASILIDLKLWLNNYSVDTKIFQNENDPVTSFIEVQKFIEGHKALSSEKVPGNTHKYLVETYSEKILNYL
jgi:hypothetical protein